MTLQKLIKKINSILNEIMEYELAGVVKYTHLALMVTGPNRIILDKFLKVRQKNHFFMLSKLVNFDSLGGHPSQKIPSISESNKHSVKDLLVESLTMKKAT